MQHKRWYIYDTKHKLKKEDWLILLYSTVSKLKSVHNPNEKQDQG